MSKHNKQGFMDLLAEFFQQEPGSVVSQFTEATEMHKDIMAREVFGKFEIEGFPEDWDYNWFMQTLFIRGYVAITDTAMGVIPLSCGLSGINVWNRPTTAIFANHILGNFERTIGVDCAVIALQYNFQGITRMLDIYSGLLASADGSVAVNLMNTRVAFVAEAENEAQSKSWKYMYDKITRGEPAVVVRKGMNPTNFYYLNPKQSYIANDVHELKRNIWQDWLCKIGIAKNVDKKQRVQSAEIDSANSECEFDIRHWEKTIREGLEKANQMFGLNLRLKVYENAPEDNTSEIEIEGDKDER